MIGPHRAGKRMVFPVADWRGMSALAMRNQAKAKQIPLNLDPDMAHRRAAAPFKKHKRIIFFKATTSL
jgi:hypothetical protein